MPLHWPTDAYLTVKGMKQAIIFHDYKILNICLIFLVENDIWLLYSRHLWLFITLFVKNVEPDNIKNAFNNCLRRIPLE